jgi:hypothetical protein
MQNDLDSDSQTLEKYIHVATFLPLKGWRYMIPFQLMTSKVLKQAKQSHGIVDYAVKADFPKKHFWTLSIWKERFNETVCDGRTPCHSYEKFEEWAGEGSAFVEWTSSNSSIEWEAAITRLQNPTFYYNKRKT